MNRLDADIKFLKGVGDYQSKLLKKLGIFTINDLLNYFPREYIFRDFHLKINELEIDEYAAVSGKIIDIQTIGAGRKKRFQITITDGQSQLVCLWFRYGKWLVKKFEINQKIWVSGQIKSFGRKYQIVHPEFEIINDKKISKFWHNRPILPVYSLTNGIDMKKMRKLIVNAFSRFHESIEPVFSEEFRDIFNFEERKIALQRIHFPTSQKLIDKAKKRFSFQEFFFEQLMLLRTNKIKEQKKYGFPFVLKKTFTSRLKNRLPFDLTSAQKNVIKEIVNDMTSKRQMRRLLQGDVGAGKTIVSLFAILLALENGFQAALMAPTEILAEQHYNSISNLLKDEDISIALLKGGVSKKKKDDKEKISKGDYDIVIGTHALIQKDVVFKKLGLVVIDEQHRFGVEQRARLMKKNNYPDLLYMTATPIPRSLSLTVFGDLEVSIIDELPPTRQPIETFWRNKKKEKKVFKEVEKEIRNGRQAYVVCPLIEKSEKIDLLDAETLFGQIKEEYLSNFNIEILHGRMKAKEKNQIMERFSKKEIDVLVSTTVIEVGIDVPNATIMIIEHAERFGLSQLHQLRGRVGRGDHKSKCYLIADYPISKEGRERLQMMVKTNDGFKIAEKDLEIRGPGEFFGTRQSGNQNYKHANIVTDQKILITARKVAKKIIAEDFKLQKDKNKEISLYYLNYYKEKEKLFKY